MSRLQNKHADPVNDRSLLLQSLLFGTGCLLVFFVAPSGFLPSNQSIIFDGGWRTVSGQIPFRDYTTPNAILPSLLQGGFFGLFGVSWFAYVLHSAVLNGLFCIVIYKWLRCFELSRSWSFFYAVLSGVIFYPPSGLPYMEQHAFFFSLCALYLAVSVNNASSNRSLGIRIAMIVLLLCAGYLSKQIPTLIFAPLVLYVAMVSGQHSRKVVALYFGYAIVGTLLVLIAAASVLGMDFGKLSYYFFQLPSSIGITRFSGLLERKRIQEFLDAYGSIVAMIGILVCVAGIIGLSYKPYRRSFMAALVGTFTLLFSLLAVYIWKSPVVVCMFLLVGYSIIRTGREVVLGSFGLATALLIGCLIFVLFTNMLWENGMPYAYLAAGLVHVSIGKEWDRKVRVALVSALVTITAIDATIFHIRVNQSRAALFMVPEDFETQPPAHITKPASLAWFKGPIYRGYLYDANDLVALANFLAAQTENFWLFGDVSVLYGIVGKPSTNPALWYHYNLTIPLPGSNEFVAYQEQLLSNFTRFNVKWIVVEDTMTKTGCKLRDLSLVNTYVQKNRIDSTMYGGVQLIRLH